MAILNEQYYIGTGEETKMYTLRVRWDEKAYVEGVAYNVTRDHYVRNLSIDQDKALVNAKFYLGEESHLLILTKLVSLNEIRRREKEEVARKRKELEEEYEKDFLAKQQILIDCIEAGMWPFGKFKGEKFGAANNSYIVYWIKLAELDSIALLLQNVLKETFPHLANLPKPNGEYFGEIKKRQLITATLIEEFGYESYYGIVYIAKFVKDSGELLCYMGSTRCAYKHIDIGEVLKFKATVKSHEIYKDENQTKIQRLAAA